MKCVIYKLDITFISKNHATQLLVPKIKFLSQRDILRTNLNFVPCEKVKIAMSLCDTSSRYCEKLHFMHTEMRTHQASNLRIQDVSKKILSDLLRNDVAKLNDKFGHFQYYAVCFPLKGKLKDIIIHFLHEIRNDII